MSVTRTRRTTEGSKSGRAKSARVKDEAAIDRAVVAEADNGAAWLAPVRVRRSADARIRLPAELAARAAFFAHLHRAPSVEEWLRTVIEERTELEEAAFASLKRDLAGRRAG